MVVHVNSVFLVSSSEYANCNLRTQSKYFQLQFVLTLSVNTFKQLVGTESECKFRRNKINYMYVKTEYLTRTLFTVLEIHNEMCRIFVTSDKTS